MSLASFLFTVLFSVIQYRAQNRSEVWGTCALSEKAPARLEVLTLGRGSLDAQHLYTLRVASKCILLNNGQKSTSVIRAFGMTLSDGEPTYRTAIPDLALIENSLVDESMLPLDLSPGGSKNFDVWIPIDLGELPLRIENLCVEGHETFKTVREFDSCFSEHGFYVAEYLYGEPRPPDRFSNGTGVSFISNENKSITFEVNIQRAFMIAAVDQNSEQIRTDYNYALERGYVQDIENGFF